ncbi:LuxR family transcriptional regulator [Roseobacter sp. HKCCA0434]|uniref:LuxR family transcriptional regulator n=1 Tax=Roseobacter sp. HKCCA0434 TaxID=3079297 RepID=UPI002905BD8F|nr:LuxR family transcriptional regulator [Roseobacter sp. HKCCA0434]
MVETGLQEFIAGSLSAQTPVALWDHTFAYMQAQGADKMSYHHFRAGDGARIDIMADGFPEDWVCEYISDELYKVDPIPELAAQMTRPFRWSDTARLASLARRQRDYLETMQDRGIGDGLAIQVFGPGLRNGYVGLGFPQGTVPSSARVISELQMAAQVAHQRYCEMTDNEVWQRPELSPREREILRWIARGRSNSQISQVLNISPHTVDAHLRKIYDKLGVTDRTSAAIVGLGSSLIQPRVQRVRRSDVERGDIK